MATAPVVLAVRQEHGWKIECWIEDVCVSWLWIHDLRWRIGSAVVRMGGIGGVGTDQAYRGRGYSRRCMDEALAHLGRERIPMAALFGIPGFYPKWGFAPVIAEPRLTIATAAALRAGGDARLRAVRFDPVRHGPAALAMYHAINHDRSGSLVARRGRSPVRKGSDWFVKAAGLALVNRRGAMEAYAAFDAAGPAMTVTEVGWRTAAVWPALTRMIARQAKIRRAGEIAVLAPSDHPYARYLRRWNIRHTVAMFADSQGMARIIRLVELLQVCESELGRRIAASRFAGASRTVRLATEIGVAVIEIRRGHVRIRPGTAVTGAVRVPQAVLTQWLLGYRSPAEPVDPAGTRIASGIRPVLTALFPPGRPYLWQADRF